MLRMECDYVEGCIPEILQAIAQENHTQLPGYSEDTVCDRARDRVRTFCGGRDDLDVHFLVGGTQANTTIISAALRPHQGVLAAQQGHISCHETGAIEATGHKVLALPSPDGKLTAQAVHQFCQTHWDDATHEHQVQPAMVYISQPTESGGLYSLQELTEMREVCDRWNLTLFVDGARLGYALASPANDVTTPDLARLTDVFYIGGTKVGALFGEAVVIRQDALKRDFRYLIKRHGGMLAKGWLLGLQFDTLLEQDRYLTVSRRAIDQALRIKKALEEQGVPFLVESWTNQLFPILPNSVLEQLGQHVSYSPWAKMDDEHTAIRLCTSWATTDLQTDTLLDVLLPLVRS